MEATTIENTLKEINSLVPHILNLPETKMWMDYDIGADVLYISFKRPQTATDTKMLDSGILLRYNNEDLVGITVLEASKRQ